MTLRKMAPADTLTSAGAFFMLWLVRKRNGMFVRGFCVEAVIADNCGRGCRNGCLRGSFCRVAGMVCTERIYAHIQYDMRLVRDFLA